MSESDTLYKLIVLYMLHKVDFPLTRAQITEFILDRGYTTYFRLQQTLSDMEESDLLRVETTHNRTLYHMTDNGRETIQFFSNRISSTIRHEIDSYLKEKHLDLQEEVSVKADYYLTTSHEYEVQCKISENGSDLIDLRLTVPTEKEAETIANKWGQKSQELYTLLISELL